MFHGIPRTEIMFRSWYYHIYKSFYTGDCTRNNE